MIDFLTAGANLPFVVALVLMVVLAFLEGVGLLLGAGLSEMFESILPDLDLDLDLDADLDVDADLDAHMDVHAEADHGGGGGHGDGHGLASFLGWLHFGRVPLMILLAMFLASFGLVGLVLQGVVHSVTGFLLPGLVASALAVVATFPVVRVTGGWMAKLLPKEETSAVSENTFIGRVARITLGTSRTGEPAEARLRDQHGQSHYVLVEPDNDGEELVTGTEVLLVQRRGAVFRAIRNPSEALVD